MCVVGSGTGGVGASGGMSGTGTAGCVPFFGQNGTEGVVAAMSATPSKVVSPFTGDAAKGPGGGFGWGEVLGVVTVGVFGGVVLWL